MQSEVSDEPEGQSVTWGGLALGAPVGMGKGKPGSRWVLPLWGMTDWGPGGEDSSCDMPTAQPQEVLALSSVWHRAGAFPSRACLLTCEVGQQSPSRPLTFLTP